MSGYDIVDAVGVDDSSDNKFVRAWCPAGKVVVGGGYYIESTVGMDLLVYTDQPFEDAVHGLYAWDVQAAEVTPTAGNWRLYTYAICVAVPTG